MRRIAIATIVLGLLSAACGPAGSGEIVTEVRDLAPFDRISVMEGLDLSLEIVPGAVQEVSVTYDHNLLDRIGTTVVDGELQIEITESFRVSGSGRFVTVVTGDLDLLHADSGADVRGTGQVDSITVSADGGASIDLSILSARHVVVDATGGSFVAVSASEFVGGNATGGADVMIIGDPAEIDVTVGGGASLVSGVSG